MSNRKVLAGEIPNVKLVTGSWNCSTSLNVIVSQHIVFVPCIPEDVKHDASFSEASTGKMPVMLSRSWSLDRNTISSIVLGPKVVKLDL